MADPHVVTALVRKRAELAGEFGELRHAIRALQFQIGHVDACLALFGFRHHPDAIRPVKPRPEQIFAKGQLKRMVLDIRREAGRGMRNRDIAVEVIRLMGWSETPALLTAMTTKVKDVTKRLPAEQAFRALTPPAANTPSKPG